MVDLKNTPLNKPAKTAFKCMQRTVHERATMRDRESVDLDSSSALTGDDLFQSDLAQEISSVNLQPLLLMLVLYKQ